MEASPAGPSPQSYTPRHLTERILTEQAALEARAAPDGERKTITALFADIKGSMELIEDLDPEEARGIVDPALQVMMDAVHRYEGYVAQSTGDGIFALFGAPIAHEDHPQRALYAALRMQEEGRRYAEKLRLERGINVQIRVGVNTGEVVVRSIRKDDLHTDYVPVGHSTGLAARMENLATPGAILVSEHTYKLTEGYFTFKALGAAQVKGAHEPIHIYEVVGIGPLRTRLQVSARRGLLRFVGRQGELAQMRRALDLARGGHGQIVGIVGEPGVGKSRLVYEFKVVSQRGCLALETFSVSHGKSAAYLPLIELLKNYFQISSQDDERRRREQVMGKVLALDRGLEDTLPYLLSLLSVSESTSPLQQMDPQIRQRRTFEVILRLLLRESLNQPLILIVEDLHWLDNETQAFLNLLSERVATARILLLVNYRPEYHHAWGSKTFYTQLRLDPLEQEEAQDLLASLLGEGLQGLKRLILEKTEGNPFFMEEIVRALVDQGVLVRDPVGAGLKPALTPALTTRSFTDLHLPPTVQGVLVARIDRLRGEEKAMLQTLSVIGKEFSLGLVRRVVEQPEEELYGLLSHLQEAEFIYEQPAFPEPEYTFKHALTQEVAYNSLLIERRKVLHERTARAMEALFQGRLEEYYAELAHHYSHGGDAQKGKAIEYLVKAGQKAAGRYANPEALDYFQRALDLIEAGYAYDRVLEDRARLLLGLFRGREASRDYERLLASAQGSGDRRQELTSLLGLASASFIVALDEPDHASISLNLYRQAYALARELDDRPSMVRSLTPTVKFLSFRPDYRDEAAANAGEAVDLSQELGDEDLIIDSLMARSHFLKPFEAEGQGEDLLRRIEARHDLLRLKEHYFHLMWLHLSRGNFERCIACCDASIHLSAEVGAPPVQYPTIKAFALLSLGRYDAAWASLQEEVADEAHPFGSAFKDLGAGRYFLELMAFEKASRVFEGVIEQAGRLRRAWLRRGARIGHARSLIRSGRLDQAQREGVVQDRADLADMGAGMSAVLPFEILGEVDLFEGKLDEALQQALSACAQAEEGGRRPDQVSGMELQARILLQLNRPGDVPGLADAALRMAEEMGYQPMVWRLRAAKARALAMLGQAEAAAQEYETAAGVILKLTETIGDVDLKRGFLSDPLVSSILAASHQPLRKEEGPL